MFSTFFPQLFGQDIRVNIKIVFSHFFTTIFFPNIFCSHYSFVSGKIVSRVSYATLFGHDIRVNIKYVFLHFFTWIFSQHFFARTIRAFMEKFLATFSPQFLVTTLV